MVVVEPTASTVDWGESVTLRAISSAPGLCLTVCTASAYDEYDSLNTYEKSVCRHSPYDCRRAAPAREDAINWTANRYASRPAHNTEADAFRHCMWSAMMTKRSNSSFAKEFGDAHEQGDFNQPYREQQMDLHNNSWGRLAGRELEGKSQRTVADRCQTYARNGNLSWFVAG